MEHLFSVWDSIKKELGTKYVCLCLDCDGTLAPIADIPERARIPQKTKDALATLLLSGKLRLAIISGRALSDIKAIVGLEGIIYVGNHGLEIDGPGISSQWKMTPVYKDSLEEIRVQLTSKCAFMPGVFLEDKGLSLCLHYRMARVDEATIEDMFRSVTDPYKTLGKIAIMHGKKVIEIRPAMGWNKGKVVHWLLTRERFLAQDENILAIYIGDDRTDEDAFKALGDSGISIMVGSSQSSSAKYYLDDTDQVCQFLEMVLKERS